MAKRLPADVLEYFRKQGAKGGRRARVTMTPEQRKARSAKASRASALARAAKKAKP